MARQRQRARDRKQAAREQQNPGPRPTEPHRANVPGELDHVSGVAEEFDAGIISGAEGDAADDGPDQEHGPRTEGGWRGAADHGRVVLPAWRARRGRAATRAQVR